MAALWPHGLIQTIAQQGLYFKAHIANIHVGISNPKESVTTSLTECLLRSIFTEGNFAISSQQPPTPTSRRQCDIEVKYTGNGIDFITVLIIECKRASASQPSSLRAMEEQVKDYYQLNRMNTNLPIIYAATMTGVHIRLWTYDLDEDVLEPL
jgi:hypothetical protein